METALDIGLANVAVATGIALLAAAAAWLIRRRPALIHALWLLVLVKLLTPPLWGVRVDWRRWVHTTPRHAVEAPPRTFGERAAPRVVSGNEWSSSSLPPELLADEGEVEAARSYEPPLVEVKSSVAVGAARAVTPPDVARAESPSWWKRIEMALPFVRRWAAVAAVMLWLLGSVACGAVVLLRVVRFQRLLRFATVAPPALQGRVAALAGRMGLGGRGPRVWFVPGAVCPMLWPVGRRGPRVLIPSELWDRLGEGQRSSLLANELAHVRRRDHWVRVAEVLASVAYWWCPLTWYARRRLREAEEQCCDAWVVWALPGAGRDYASALVETVEFVAARGIAARSRLPVLASGMGQFHQLKRRLVMIKQAHVSRRLSGAGWLAVSALSLGLLPLAPTFAEPNEAAPTAAVPAGPGDVKVDDDAAAPATALPGTTAAAAPATVDIRPGALAVTAPTISATPAVVVHTRPSVSVTPLSIGNDNEDDNEPIINELKSKQGKTVTIRGQSGDANYVAGSLSVDGKSKTDAKNEAKLEAARAEVRELSKQLERAQRKLMDLETANANKLKAYPKMPDGKLEMPKLPTPALPPGKDPTQFKNENKFDGYRRQSSSSSSDFRQGAGGPGMNPWGAKGYADTAAADAREKRLAAVEANLKALLEEVRSMRDERRDDRPDKPGAHEHKQSAK